MWIFFVADLVECNRDSTVPSKWSRRVVKSMQPREFDGVVVEQVWHAMQSEAQGIATNALLDTLR